MLALADHAHDDGTEIRPGLARLAWKTGYSDQQVRRILVRLRDKKKVLVLTREGGGRGKPNVYRIDWTKAVKKSPFVPPNRNPQKGDITDEKGDIPGAKGDAAVSPEPSSTNRPSKPSDSSGPDGPPERDAEEDRPISYRAYAFRRFRELIKEAKEAGHHPDPLPDSRLGEYSAFYEQHAKEGADPDDLDDAIRWLVAKAAGEVEDEAQAWAYFGTAVRAVLNGGVRRPFSVIEGGKTSGEGVRDGARRRSSAGYTEGYEFLFERG